MKQNIRLVYLLLVFVAGGSLSAQFTATGKVTDDAGEPLVGATILVKGTTTGGVTDFDGNYSIAMPSNEGVLVLSYTGFQTTEIPVSSTSPSKDITLEVGQNVFDEVVVVGYGATRKEALTGAVSTIDAAQLEQVPFASLEGTLQGNVAGLQSVSGNGQPGANSSIRIRGQGSFSASSEPLYVIDGIPVISGSLSNNTETSNPLTSINPNDVQSVTVLKDASATAIYGARGANGVILITTKGGRSGKAKVELRTSLGSNDWAVNDSKRLRGLTSQEYTELYIEGYQNIGQDITTIVDRFNGQFPGAVDFDAQGNIQNINIENQWIEELSRTGLQQSYDLAVSGGSDKVTYYASGSYFDQEAPIIGSDLNRYSGRVNLNVKALKWLEIQNNLNVSRVQQNGMNDATRWANPMYNGYLLAPVIPARNEEGQFYDGHKSFFMGGNNPIGSLSGDDTQQWTQTRILENLSATVKFTDKFFFKSAWAFDLLNYDEFYFRNARYGDGRNANGIGAESIRRQLSWIGTQTLNYSTTIGDAHNIGGLVGYEANKTDRRSIFATAENYPDPSLRTLASAATPTTASSNLTEWSFESLFGQINYNYNYRYYLSASLRRDGSSRFGTENRYGTFWSVGASWRISEEGFMAGNKVVQDLKLRTSYGITGNAGIGNYDAVPTFTFAGVDYDGNPGGAPGQIGNIELTWEQATNFNVGLDFGLFNRLTGTLEYFQRDNDDLLLDLPVSRTTGFTEITQNFGAMRNSGIELTLNAMIIDKPDFNWSVGGNISFLKNEITRLDEEFIAGTKQRSEGSDFQTYFLFGYAGVNPDNGDPLFYTDETEAETTSSISEATRYVNGKTATPSSFGGFNTSLGFKGLTLDAQIVFSFDNWIYDNTGWVLQGDGRFTPRSQTNLVLNRWQNPGDVTDVPRFAWGNRSGGNTRNSTRYLFDGSYMRLRNVTLAYTLPTSLVEGLGLANVRTYIRGINLFTWTKDKDLYLDPEAEFSGVVNSPVPNLKNLSFGIDVTF